MMWRVVRAVGVLVGSFVLAFQLAWLGHPLLGFTLLGWIGAAILWSYDEGRRHEHG